MKYLGWAIGATLTLALWPIVVPVLIITFILLCINSHHDSAATPRSKDLRSPSRPSSPGTSPQLPRPLQVQRPEGILVPGSSGPLDGHVQHEGASARLCRYLRS